MALSHPVKVVLKSTTTQTLSDRFTEMVKTKAPAKSRQKREDGISNARASAKNRRLAEQMSHRSGGKAMMDQINKESVKDRIDQSKVQSNVHDRLGTTKRGSSVQNRLGRGATSRMGSKFSSNIRGSRGSRGTRSRGGGLSTRGRGRPSNSDLAFRGTRGARSRGRPRGSGIGRGNGIGRGRGRGRGSGRGKQAPNRDNLDNELEVYMSATKS